MGSCLFCISKMFPNEKRKLKFWENRIHQHLHIRTKYGVQGVSTVIPKCCRKNYFRMLPIIIFVYGTGAVRLVIRWFLLFWDTSMDMTLHWCARIGSLSNKAEIGGLGPVQQSAPYVLTEKSIWFEWCPPVQEGKVIWWKGFYEKGARKEVESRASVH